MEININARKIIFYLILALAVLFILNVAVQIAKIVFGYDYLLGLVPLFDFYEEANIPTWFSSLLLLIASSLFFLIGWFLKGKNADNFFRWLLLGVIFTVLSVDETAQLHEKTGTILRHFINPDSFYYNVWVVAGALLMIVFVIYFFRFWWNLQPRYRLLFFLSAFIYVGASLGFEILENILYKSYHYGSQSPVQSLLISGEETLEMIAIILLIYTLLSFLKEISFEIKVALK